MRQFKNKKNRYGFTLIETLVAISIIMIGLTAAFDVAQLGISSSSFAKNRTSAYFLAQEALEAVKAKRDHNLLLTNLGTPTNWLDGLTGGTALCDNYLFGCDYDLKSTLADVNADEVFLSCTDINANGCNLQIVPGIAPGTYYYGHGGTPSLFTRRLFITEFNGGTEASVRVVVTWPGGSFETVNYIFSWF